MPLATPPSTPRAPPAPAPAARACRRPPAPSPVPGSPAVPTRTPTPQLPPAPGCAHPAGLPRRYVLPALSPPSAREARALLGGRLLGRGGAGLRDPPRAPPPAPPTRGVGTPPFLCIPVRALTEGKLRPAEQGWGEMGLAAGRERTQRPCVLSCPAAKWSWNPKKQCFFLHPLTHPSAPQHVPVCAGCLLPSLPSSSSTCSSSHLFLSTHLFILSIHPSVRPSFRPSTLSIQPSIHLIRSMYLSCLLSTHLFPLPSLHSSTHFWVHLFLGGVIPRLGVLLQCWSFPYAEDQLDHTIPGKPICKAQ